MKGIMIPGNITGHSIFVEAMVGAIVLLIGVAGFITGLGILTVAAAVVGGVYVIYSAWSSSKILNGMSAQIPDSNRATIRYMRAANGGYLLFESDDDLE